MRSIGDPSSQRRSRPPRGRRCSVLVSKLDRLSRDVAFVSGLMAQHHLELLEADMAAENIRDLQWSLLAIGLFLPFCCRFWRPSFERR